MVFGVRSVDPQLVDAARTMGASRSDVFLKVNLPYALPYIMAGITIGVGIGWMCMVTAEMMGSVGGGVGTYILTQSNIGNWAKVFVGIIVIAILGMASIGTAKFAEKRLLKMDRGITQMSLLSISDLSRKDSPWIMVMN